MMFRGALAALFASSVVAKDSAFDASGSIPVSSNAGQELLMKATVVQEARFLNNNNNDYSWMASYSIRYTGCTSLIQVGGQGNNNNKNNNNQGMLFTQHLVRFSLCPVDSCNSSCPSGGHYVVSMADFVDLYTEAKLSQLEYQCELVREACYCDDANDDQACENQCYTDKGLTDCIDIEGEEDFEVQRYLECQEMKDNNNNNNNNNYNYNGEYYYGQYYIGPYCPDGKNIYLGLFYDQGCSAQADVSQYASRMGGATLPYSSTSMVIEGDCIACATAQENNNGDGEVQYEIGELCSTTWGEAARCEASMENMAYPDTSACDYIENVLPRLDAASRSMGVGVVTYVKKGKAAKAFAFIFAFTTVLFGAYAYFLYRKIKRGVVALSAQG